MLTATLGQQATQGILDALGAKVGEFRANFARWQAEGKSDLARLPTDLARIKADLLAGQQRLYRAGDIEGFRALGARITEVEALERKAAEVASYAGRWSGTWETLASWLGQVGGMFGLGVLPLALPLALSIPVALAAIAALAWVVSSWLDTRARAQSLRELAAQVSAGTLTAQQAGELVRAAAPAPGIFGGLGGLGTTALLVLGVLAVAAFALRR